MRNIKFRGYAQTGPEFGKSSWVIGYLTFHPVVKEGNRVPFITDEITLNMYQVEPESVGEFTGLLDKNGKEIYEGDILKWVENDGPYDPPAPVVFMHGSFCWDMAPIGQLREEYIAIGNIHESPHLIK